ncbi:MAG TPA: PAS domain-containing protein [Sphaerochaeta sp.]|nr:PAS domain-containing protein [Sphaerochaeta sp.]
MELLQNENTRTVRLIEYLKLLIDKNAGKAEFLSYEADLHSTTPFEVNDALDHVLSKSDDVESLAQPIAQFIRAVSKSLEASPKPIYPKGHLLHGLTAENIKIQDFASQVQKLALQIQQAGKKGVGEQAPELASLKALVASSNLLSSHYVRLQNELFPLFEMEQAHHSCVKLMWALQDRALALRKKMLSEHSSLTEFWKIFGQFFFHMQILLYREEHILFPVAFRSIPEDQASEKGVAGSVANARQAGLDPSLFVSPTGSLDFVVLEQIFKLLPLDIAFIGSDDRLQFYSDPPHRIFPRSPQLIGRLVQNCHPPKSVAIVEKILTSFKEGSEDSAEFYLMIGEKFIHIEYFAVRNVDNTYLGTLEVTQDATHLRALVGQKRLL